MPTENLKETIETSKEVIATSLDKVPEIVQKAEAAIQYLQQNYGDVVAQLFHNSFDILLLLIRLELLSRLVLPLIAFGLFLFTLNRIMRIVKMHLNKECDVDKETVKNYLQKIIDKPYDIRSYEEDRILYLFLGVSSNSIPPESKIDDYKITLHNNGMDLLEKNIHKNKFLEEYLFSNTHWFILFILTFLYLSFYGFYQIFSLWNWIGLFYPEMYLFHSFIPVK